MLSDGQSTLFLIPVPISEGDINWSLPLEVIRQVAVIQTFIVENSKTARRFLKSVHPEVNLSEITMFELDKHHPETQTGELKKLLTSRTVSGLLSESGMPCLADPGNHVVEIAHQCGIRVRPLTGPSSIILALVASGLNGQQFTFNGYLPGKPDERKQAIRALEKLCRRVTQLFIETPYRNDVMFSDLLQTLRNDTRVLVARDIGGNEEYIRCLRVSEWKELKDFRIGKLPCMFGLG